MFSLILPSQVQIRDWRRASFLEDAMEQDHSLPAIHIKEDARNAVPEQFCANFMETIAHRTASWHSNRPPEFNGLDILPDHTPILCGHRFEPGSYRFVSRFGAVKGSRNALLPNKCTMCGTSGVIFLRGHYFAAFVIEIEGAEALEKLYFYDLMYDPRYTSTRSSALSVARKKSKPGVSC